jgi:hypothetical protein
MRTVRVFAAAAFCVLVLGCEKAKPREAALPGVTLVERMPRDGTLLLRFCFQDMDRFDWKRKVLKAQLVKADGKPEPGGPAFRNPAPEFSINLAIGKVAGSDSSLFVASWGKSTHGLIDESERLELPGPDGVPNLVTVPGTEDFQITQILRPCTGPNLRIPFDPDRGIDLLRIEPSLRAAEHGQAKPEAFVLRVWAERATSAPSAESGNP